MCGVCGCGDSHIEGDEHHGHSHDHGHGHHHHHGHSHGHQPQPTVIVHHHHYYGVMPPAAGAPAVHSHARSDHSHHHHEEHTHSADEVNKGQDLHYGHGEAGVHVSGLSQRRLMKIERDVLEKNDELAAHNREHFKKDNHLVLNLVSSPGSGKTTTLCETLKLLKGKRKLAVIEGDQQTTNDADRIRETGVQALQVNTGKGCHLDAQMVHDACHKMELEPETLLFVENVGNLVCPSSFDLGEKYKVAILSVTEGEDKPLKYPNMFAASSLMIINKIDLLPYVAFNVEKCIENARKVNPYIQVIQLSATTGEGMEAWLSWLEQA
ncbi:hydrogenase nickel incorporation protein HypB [Sansalvadorimonas verongulae]|uniref:hydrogenase nickel incorporation protein HypB n=1 Tax=Sansalvadorimonas verongulae TaxID=2172824 RepID=UPI0012BD7B9F|nr:hydrogenase nickel incorporation protein HypB [Sansalvadorimonas verongulae]MTI15375.1 hydrogenase nickel incorporation protein HypB [Sansalvadorimonas verongulae]